MERQLPKNVRQIGNVSDNPKIYVEDYVDTYLNQLREKAREQPVGVILTGELLKLEDENAVFVSGAVQMKEVKTNGNDIEITDEKKLPGFSRNAGSLDGGSLKMAVR